MERTHVRCYEDRIFTMIGVIPKSGEAAAVESASNNPKVIRLGYDLFEEVNLALR